MVTLYAWSSLWIISWVHFTAITTEKSLSSRKRFAQALMHTPYYFRAIIRTRNLPSRTIESTITTERHESVIRSILTRNLIHYTGLPIQTMHSLYVIEHDSEKSRIHSLLEGRLWICTHSQLTLKEPSTQKTLQKIWSKQQWHLRIINCNTL